MNCLCRKSHCQLPLPRAVWTEQNPFLHHGLQCKGDPRWQMLLVVQQDGTLENGAFSPWVPVLSKLKKKERPIKLLFCSIISNSIQFSEVPNKMSSVCKMQLIALQLQHTGCGKHWFKSLFCLIQSGDLTLGLPELQMKPSPLLQQRGLLQAFFSKNKTFLTHSYFITIRKPKSDSGLETGYSLHFSYSSSL